MKRGIIAAIFVSILLIGSTVWLRFFKGVEANQNNQLVAIVNEKLSDEYYDEMLSKFLAPTSTTTGSTEALTTTDLIGRQMLMEYLSLAQAGQATEANITALSEKYVESIPTIIAAEKFIPTELKIVSNNTGNMETYSISLEQAYRGYAAVLQGSGDLEKQLAAGGKSNLLLTMRDTYKNLAESLGIMKVPAGTAKDHADLINIYRENTAAIEGISSTKDDAAVSFAGIITLKKNADREIQAMSNIRKVLESSGI